MYLIRLNFGKRKNILSRNHQLSLSHLQHIDFKLSIYFCFICFFVLCNTTPTDYSDEKRNSSALSPRSFIFKFSKEGFTSGLYNYSILKLWIVNKALCKRRHIILYEGGTTLINESPSFCLNLLHHFLPRLPKKKILFGILYNCKGFDKIL